MSEKISTEAYIDQQLDNSALAVTLDMTAELKQSYVQASIGKDAYDFYKLFEADAMPFEGEDVTVDNLLYYSASEYMDTWIRATANNYLPSHVSMCDIDDQSVMVSINNAEHVPLYLNMYARFTLEAEREVDRSVYFYDRRPNASTRRPILEGFYEEDGRSVQGVDIITLQGDITLALAKTYSAWFEQAGDAGNIAGT